MRPQPQGPRLPASAATAAEGVAAAPAPAPVPVPVPTFLPPAAPRAPAMPACAAPPASDDDTPAEKAARAGGFHESSYELQHGLQVSESEWPDDVTVPGRLGER